MHTTDHIEQNKVFIGVSWPYASANIHIGHLAGQYVVCDVFGRYNRLRGNKVLMVSGSDCHGAPNVFAAEEQGITPEELVARSHKEIVETYEELGFLYENYTSTHTDNHKKVVQNIFLALDELGYMDIKKSRQYFDEKVERFLPDRYVRGTCPKCGATNARGDECPECGAFLNAEDLIEPYSTLSDTKPVMKETEHYFLDLSKATDRLKEWLTDKTYWRTWVKEFTDGWIKEGLLPRAVTRDMKFGIPVPVEGWENKVIYVWIEAVVGYLSAAIEWAEKHGDPSNWEEFWKDPKVKHYYFIAGGNVPFHTIIWPAELIAYNDKYSKQELFEKYKLPGETMQKQLNLPYDVPANKILMLKGKKMSKGDKTGITLDTLLAKYNPDLLRYFFVKYAPENHDREFTWKDFIDANNNELVANIGNFINRTISFTQSKFDGIVPEGHLDTEVAEQIEKAFRECAEHLEACEFTKGIETILELGHFANKYFNDQKPWETVKTSASTAANTLYNSIQIVSAFRVLLKPFTPFSADKILTLLGQAAEIDPNHELAATGEVKTYKDFWSFNEIPVGQKLGKAEILFEKLEYTQDLQDADNSDGTDKEKVSSLTVKADEKLKDIPIISKVFTGLTIKKRSAQTDKWIAEKVEELKTKYSKAGWENSPTFAGYRKLYEKYAGLTDTKSAPEKLINFIFERGTVPNINTFVDVYNIISALTGVSIGAHDADKIAESPKFVRLQEDTHFRGVNSEFDDTANEGEYAYVDSKGVLCRMDIKQCERTKVTPDTKNVLVIMQGHENLGKDELEKTMTELTKALEMLKS